MNKVAIALLALASVANGEVLKEGSYEFIAGGRVHRVQYSFVQAVPDEAIVAIDNTTGLRDKEPIWCYGWAEVQLFFNEEKDSKAFMKLIDDKVSSEEGAFVVTDGHGCNFHGGSVDSTDNSTGMNLRRVKKAKLSGFPSQIIVTLETNPAHYGEVIKEGAISYGSSPDNPGRNPLHLCFGMNVGDAAACNTAAGALPVYSAGDALSITCDNCFMGFSFDLFSDFHFKNFAMAKLAAGFKNMQASGAVSLAMNVNLQKSFVGIEKELWHAGGDDKPIVTFKVGLIPFSISFNAAINLAADMQCNAAAQAQAGVTVEHVIGNNYMQWDSSADSGKKWVHVVDTPKTTFTPTVSGSANFDCTGSLSLVPSFDLKMSQLFSFQMAVTPKVSVEIKGDTDSMQLCETASYDVEMSSSAQMHFSMAFGLIRADASWGPKTWGKSSQGSKTHCQGNKTAAMVVV